MNSHSAPIKKRIIEFIESRGLTKSTLFSNMGISDSNFKGKNASSEAGGEMIVKVLTEFPEINPTWLLLGTGEMTIQPNDDPISLILSKLPEEEATVIKRLIKARYLQIKEDEQRSLLKKRIS